ncbi:hypothetical protein T231_04130 [Tannerella sp. oral taxon BU063 isolate Cell 6/7/9]|uniref:Cytochrome c domain-containing protein n=1 Tax=Tannerella sp. oral taxon BU063 isolate Cell 6/7/9 TaxID=1411021 RepID=W2CTU6_9BACT|nr:hypothetical protein T231_04130 [Tannerella sp. oral taxon BU063 isolate Cell 6/7/9]
MTLVGALGGSEDTKVKDFLQSLLADKSLNLKIRQKATEMYGNGYSGQDKLMTLVAAKKLPAELDTTAQKALLKAWRSDVKLKAMAFYNKGQSNTTLAPVGTLVRLTGNAGNGETIFTNVCSSCHRVNNDGTNFGPDLSEIGAKYGKEGLYQNILNPDAGIAFGYDGYLIKTKDGNQLLGYISAETKEDLSVKGMGGTITKIKKSDVVSKKPYEHSLMPTGLLSTMKQQDAVDLIEYVSSLKKKS